MATKKKNEKFVKAPLARVSYPNVWKMQEFSDDSKPSYNCVLLIPKTPGCTKWRDDPKLTDMKKALIAAAKEKWGKVPNEMKLPFKDGDKKADPDDPKDPRLGMWIISAKSDRKPQIVLADAQTFATEENFYAGCWAFFTLNGYGWTNEYKQSGVSFGLQNIQKVKDDERLGGIPTARDQFEPVDEEFADSPDDGDDDGWLN